MRVFFITKNRGKLTEAKFILGKYGIEVIPLNIEKLEIQHEDIEIIAMYSIKSIKGEKGPIFIEDDALYINALSGFPGPYASYVYKTLGLNGVLKLLEGVKDRSAHFKSVVALKKEDMIHVFTGVVKGRISEDIRGKQGFGFDPIFIPEGYNITFAEMSLEEKCNISHRAKALKKLATWLKNHKS